MKEMICIVCPRGCHLAVNEETFEVLGNSCPKGSEYGKNELTNPMRTVTGSVEIIGGIHSRLPVRTDRAVPKAKMFDIMEELHAHICNAPVKRGHVLIENICGTGANVISSRDM